MRVLAVGIATLDILNTVAEYPREDDEIRVLHHRINRGGNATNTLVVLSQLGVDCSWAGTLSDEPDSRPILEDLARYHIDTRYCRSHADGKVPTSYVLLSKASGSRTILHYRDLPEYRAEDFFAIDTREFDWIHFEGRNVTETERMLRHLRVQDGRCPISLEVEKPREAIERLYPYPDVLLFSRAFSLARGFRRATDLFASTRQVNPRALLFCAWGKAGAWLQTPAGGCVHEPAVQRNVVDTLAAGDVFNAGVIDALLHKQSPDQALQKGVRLAGDKCTQYGLANLISPDAR